MAATDKHLARSNKSGTEDKATKKRVIQIARRCEQSFEDATEGKEIIS